MQRTTDTSRDTAPLTAGQIAILDSFATIQAELECVLRDTIRTRRELTKDARMDDDRA